MVFRGIDSNNFLLKSIPQGIPIDGKLYHFKEKFYPANGSVKVKNFFR